MKISTRGRYASRAMLYIACRGDKGPVTLKSICKDEKISHKYLENIMRSLVNAGIVLSLKGNKGGFRLAKKPSEIRLSDILQAAEGSLDPVYCVSAGSECAKGKDCIFKDVWTELKLRTIQYLASMTLSDLMKRQEVKNKATGKKKSASIKSTCAE